MWRVIPAIKNYSQSTRKPRRGQAGCTCTDSSPPPLPATSGAAARDSLVLAEQRGLGHPGLLPHMPEEHQANGDLPQCWGRHLV